MKKTLALMTALTVCAMMLTGCGDNADSTSKTAAASSQAADESAAEVAKAAEKQHSPSEVLLEQYPVNNGAYDFTQGATENMLARAVLNRGDTSRLAAKIKRALDDPTAQTNICYMGDSITAGTGAAKPSEQYTSLITQWWTENVSDAVTETNAGIGATNSYLAVHRAYRDIPEDTDIIFIEFINDEDSELYQAAADSLVRQCLAMENEPAVIIIEPSCEGGSSPQDTHLKVAQTYDIPMISYHDAIIPEIDAGNFAWSDTSNDNVHPNSAGHAVMAQCVTEMIGHVKDNIADENTSPSPFDASAVPSPTGDRFAGAILGSADTADIVTVTDEGTFTKRTKFQSFDGGWGSESGGSAVFEIECRELGILYLCDTSGKYGMAAVKVDDNDPVIIDGNFKGGWGSYPKTQELFSSDKTEKHTIKIEIINGETNPCFDILSWLIS